ncbi:MAG: lipocalin family protein [Chitinophagaceae bacterium]
MKQLIGIIIVLFFCRTGFAQDKKSIVGTWKVTAMAFDFDGDGQSDRDLWRPCREGSTFTFREDGNGNQYKGAKPCGNPAQNPVPFHWSSTGADMISMQQGANSELVQMLYVGTGSLKLYWKKSKLLLQLER